MPVSRDPLIHVLDAGRRRLRARAMIAIPISAFLSGSVVWLGLNAIEFARRSGLVVIDNPLPAISIAMAAALIGATIAAAFWTLRVLRIEPKQLALAIDRLAGMNLSFATAVDAVGDLTPGPVGKALVADARNRAAVFDVARLLPLWIRPLRYALMAALIFFSAGMTLHMALIVPPDARIVQNPLEADVPSADESRSRAEDIARQLAREATLRQDPMLAAIARALEERVIKAAENTEAKALDDELNALIDQAKSAFGESVPSWLGNEQQASQLQNSANQPAGNAGGQNVDLSQGIDAFEINPEDIERARQAQFESMEAKGDDPDFEIEGLQRIEPGTAEPASASTFTPEKMDAEALQFAGRESAGAAQDSGKGPADQAGLGSRALEGEALAAESGAEMPMALPQAAQETGRRIRITLPPSQEELAAGANTAGGVATSGGGYVSRRPVERSPVPSGRQSAVGRYFQRAAE